MSFFVHWKSIFFLLTFKEFGVNSIYKYASTARLKSKTFALQYLGKNHLNCLENLLFESLFLSFRRHFWLGSIFDQRLLFDYKQLCIWPLELSEHYEPGNHSKNQRLKPLRNSLNVRFLDMTPCIITSGKYWLPFTKLRGKHVRLPVPVGWIELYFLIVWCAHCTSQIFDLTASKFSVFDFSVEIFAQLAWFRVNGTPKHTNFRPVENSSVSNLLFLCCFCCCFFFKLSLSWPS